MKRLYLLSCLFFVSTASASTLVDFETAQTLKPQHVELSGQMAAGDSVWAVGARGRVGLLPRLDGQLSMAGVVINDEVGYEFNLGGRYQLLTTAQTLGWVDVAVSTDMALTMAGPLLMTSLDVRGLASRAFEYATGRDVTVGLAAGLTETMYSVSGGANGNRLGWTAGAVIQLDLGPALKTGVDIAYRDDVKRFGIVVAKDF